MPLPNFREQPRQLPVVNEVAPPWQTLTIAQTLAQLETNNQTGLTDRAITQRRQQFGTNERLSRTDGDNLIRSTGAKGKG